MFLFSWAGWDLDLMGLFEIKLLRKSNVRQIFG